MNNLWEEKYLQGTNLSTWPWSDLVSYVGRYALPPKDFNEILELGCGMGANIPFFLSRKNNYYAMEGSRAAVDFVVNRFPELMNKIECGDFTKNIPFSGPFDLIVDRASLTCNETTEIIACLKLLNRLLRKGGIFVGIDWYSKFDNAASEGFFVDDNTRMNIPFGPLANLGKIHFSDKKHLYDLFENNGFKILALEHKVNEDCVTSNLDVHAAFNLAAIKI
jgi:SAM-dependent methyltransferase